MAELAGRFEVPLLEDIAYLAPDTPSPIAAHANRKEQEILTVSGLAKSVWAGLRIGWVRGPLDVVERLARFKALADMGTAVIDQALAARLLPRVPELSVTREQTRRARMTAADAMLRDQIPAWRWSIPAGGPALWIELPGENARLRHDGTSLRRGGRAWRHHRPNRRPRLLHSAASNVPSRRAGRSRSTPSAGLGRVH